jgi:hypothetical protein
MRKPEQKLWDSMKRNKPSGVSMERVENAASEGFPDVFVMSANAWVELKAPKLPARHTTRLFGKQGLSVDQINWHLRAARFGVHSFILARDDALQLYLIPGSAAQVMNDMPWNELEFRWAVREWVDVWLLIDLAVENER